MNNIFYNKLKYSYTLYKILYAEKFIGIYKYLQCHVASSIANDYF